MTGDLFEESAIFSKITAVARSKKNARASAKKSELLSGAKTCLLFFETNFAFHLLSGKPARQRLQVGKLEGQYWI